MTLDGAQPLDLTSPGGTAVRVASSYWVWLGLVIFALSAVVWLIVLSRASLSFAYPFASLTYVIILLFDRFVLDQSIPGIRVRRRRAHHRRHHPDLPHPCLSGATLAGRPADVAVVIVNYNSGDDVDPRRAVGDGRRGRRTGRGRGGRQRTPATAAPTAPRPRVPGIRVIRSRRNAGFGSAANVGMRAHDRAVGVPAEPRRARITAGTLGGLLKVAADRPEAGAIGVLTRNPRRLGVSLGPQGPDVRRGRAARVRVAVPPGQPLDAAYDDARLGPPGRALGRLGLAARACCCDARRSTASACSTRTTSCTSRTSTCARACAAPGWDVWFTPELEVTHIGGTATRGKRRMTLEHSRSMYRYFVKHRSPGALAVAAAAGVGGASGARGARVAQTRKST